jgi:hypothetical protein
MKEKDISATASALQEELKARILEKVKSIETKILDGERSSDSAYIQMLMMVDEDLDDVLLNWEYDSISARRIGSYSDDFDEDDF